MPQIANKSYLMPRMPRYILVTKISILRESSGSFLWRVASFSENAVFDALYAVISEIISADCAYLIYNRDLFRTAFGTLRYMLRTSKKRADRKKIGLGEKPRRFTPQLLDAQLLATLFEKRPNPLTSLSSR